MGFDLFIFLKFNPYFFNFFYAPIEFDLQNQSLIHH